MCKNINEHYFIADLKYLIEGVRSWLALILSDLLPKWLELNVQIHKENIHLESHY